MSVDRNDLGEADIMLAQAVARAVRELGRSLATEPRRLQGMVNDVLGAESRTRRAEIDAVVLAAEESIPEDLLTERIDVDAALERLRERGLDAGVALFAVEVWRYALGMLAVDAQPPSLTNSMLTSTRSRTTDPAPVTRSDLGADATSTFWPAPIELPTVAGGRTQVLADLPAARHPHGSKRKWLLVAAPVIVLALVAAVVVAALGNDTEDASVSSTVANSTTTESATTTSAAVATETVFDLEPTPLGELTRTWTVTDLQLDSTLVFNNTTGAPTTGRYYEVIPKSMAVTADLITSESPHTVIKNDPVIAWDVTIPAGQSVEVKYQLPVTADVTIDTLNQWKSEQVAEATAFTAERNTPPALTIDTPSGLVGAEADVSGTTDPGATVTLNGTQVAVNADGTWLLRVTGLGSGPNAITVIATNAYETTATQTLTINGELPAPDTTVPQIPETTPQSQAPTTTRGTRPGSGGAATTTTATTTPPVEPPTVTTVVVGPPTVTTVPVVPSQPPALAMPTVSISGPPSVDACTRYWVDVRVSNATSGRWSGSWGWSEAAVSQKVSNVSGDNASAYSIWIEYIATGPGGSASDRMTITVAPDPTTDQIRPLDECVAAAG